MQESITSQISAKILLKSKVQSYWTTQMKQSKFVD